MTDQAMLKQEIRDKLMDCGLFNHIPPVELTTAAGYFIISSMKKGEEIFHEGDAGTFMCIIHSGHVSVQKTNQDNVQVEMAVLRKGTFGEMAVLDGERRSATCIAATDCYLLNLGKDSLDKMINDAPKVAAKIIRALAVALSRRLRMVDGQLLAKQA
ncbi:cyclic nucleotide-binding domain-containing protein [Pseudomonas sp. dw_358]|uniref:cyclic nucleotide-binding domain-containing protein n=1 Tax=Pseudomonas sp. dw_358 TaxID=2720083 RepID=UPI001BD5858E|nr:cyclic nucleotide-binding domain-containing protein [Pseudomonas sp. dw_358]